MSDPLFSEIHSLLARIDNELVAAEDASSEEMGLSRYLSSNAIQRIQAHLRLSRELLTLTSVNVKLIECSRTQAEIWPNQSREGGYAVELNEHELYGPKELLCLHFIVTGPEGCDRASVTFTDDAFGEYYVEPATLPGPVRQAVHAEVARMKQTPELSMLRAQLND